MILRPSIISAKPASASVYHASAVHFDGNAYLSINGLTATDNGKLTFAVFTKATLTGSPSNYATLIVVDPLNNYSTSFTLNFNGTNTPTAEYPSFVLEPSDGVSPGRLDIDVPNGSAIPDSTWNCLLFSCNADFATPDKQAAFYLGDTLIIGTPTMDNSSAFTNILNGAPFYVGSDAITDAGFDCANLLLWSGIQVDFSITANRRLIIDSNGKPVNPTVAITALGNPTVALIGDHTTFPTNQGTGGAFTLTGTLTDASSSPSD